MKKGKEEVSFFSFSEKAQIMVVVLVSCAVAYLISYFAPFSASWYFVSSAISIFVVIAAFVVAWW